MIKPKKSVVLDGSMHVLQRVWKSG